MAIELGALALAIRDQGGDLTLEKLGKIDAAAEALGKQPIDIKASTETRQVINYLTTGLEIIGKEVVATNAKSVAAFRESAASSALYAKELGATAAEMAQIGAIASQVERRVVAAEASKTNATQRTNTALQQQGRTLFNAQGQIQTLGTKGLTAINALAFGVSQFAATGEASFRSLATSVGSFLAFLGPEGAIASLAITTGLALYDFFTRTQKGIEDTARKAAEETRRAVREVQLAVRTGDRDALEKRAKDVQFGTVDRAGVVDVREQVAALDKQITAKQQELANLTEKGTIAERQDITQQLTQLRAQRAQAVLQLASLEDEISTLAKKVTELSAPRAATEAIKVTAERAKSEKDIVSALSRQVTLLAEVAKLHKLTRADVEAVSGLETALNAALKRNNGDLALRLEIEKQIAELKKTGLTLEKQKVRDTTPATTATPAKTLGIPEEAQKKFDEVKPVFDKPLTDFEQSLASGLTNAIVGGLATGFANGLAQGGIGEGFRQMGAQLLAGLANVFLEVGAKAILGSQLIAKLATGLANINPLFAIAAGVALVALARAMGGTRGGGATPSFGSLGGSGAFSFRETISDPSTRLVGATLPSGATLGGVRASTPAAGPVIRVIGATSPEGQRLIGTANAQFVRRGGTG